MKIDTTLIIGGCRSGKSSHAVALAEQAQGNRRIYVATCVPMDDEMRDRVERHQAERGSHWRTVETPIDIGPCIEEQGAQADVILVDCLTLWISNLMGKGMGQDAIVAEAKALGNHFQATQCPVILVSNEVGAGIVPENSIARQFRDTAGLVNQLMAKVCTKVIWTVAGIPVSIKE